VSAFFIFFNAFERFFHIFFDVFLFFLIFSCVGARGGKVWEGRQAYYMLCVAEAANTTKK